MAGAERLLALVRGHWQIENELHYLIGVTLGEERSLIHQGNGPGVMAILRDTIVSVLHPPRDSAYSGHPTEALALFGVWIAENA